MQSGFVQSNDGTRIGYTRYGAGPTVVLINGALGYRGHRGMGELAQALSGRFCAIDYDRRGRGESGDTAPYHVDREIEDIEALIGLGEPAFLYGFSSGAGLALLAAERLGEQIAGLAMMEPPYGENTAVARREHDEFLHAMRSFATLGKREQALDLFLGGMLPPEMLAEMKRGPDWPLMLSVAHTLYYDCEVLRDGVVPAGIAARIAAPTVVLAGAESMDFKRAAVRALAAAIPNGEEVIVEGHDTMAPPEAIAPILMRHWS